MKSIILIVKGFFMGLTNLIPGVSGGTIAIVLGIYDKLINVISHLFKNFKENIKFIIPIGIGIVLSVLTMSKVISFALEKYLFITILFFVGAIAGGIPMLYNKVKGKKKDIISYIIFTLTFMLIIGLTFLTGDNEITLTNDIIGMIKILFVGIIAAGTMIIPGISGSAVLMTLGYYEPILSIVKDITNFSNLGYNLSICIPFGIGVLLGVFLIAKLIEYLFKKYETKTYYGVLGFVFSSMISILIQNIFMNNITITILDIVIGLVLFGLGFMIAYKLGDK